MGLAGDAANDARNVPAKLPAVEGLGIVPNRCRSQETRLHRRDQMGDGEGFPLHHSDGAASRHCKVQSEVEPGPAGADGKIPAGVGSVAEVGT